MILRLKFGDHLLAERGITVVAGAERGCDIPKRVPLTRLKPHDFLDPNESSITGRELLSRARNESGPHFAPWGRKLLWRILNKANGRGGALLKTLDKSRTYLFAGDCDLQDQDGSAVLLYLKYRGDQWCWGSDIVARDDWGNQYGQQLLVLGGSSD